MRITIIKKGINWTPICSNNNNNTTIFIWLHINNQNRNKQHPYKQIQQQNYIVSQGNQNSKQVEISDK